MAAKTHAMHGRDHLPDGMDPVAFTASATVLRAFNADTAKHYTVITGFDQSVRLIPANVKTNDSTVYGRDSSGGLYIKKAGVYFVNVSINFNGEGINGYVPPQLALYLEIYTPTGGPDPGFPTSVTSAARDHRIMPTPADASFTPTSGVGMRVFTVIEFVSDTTGSDYCSFFTAFYGKGATENWGTSGHVLDVFRLGDSGGASSITL